MAFLQLISDNPNFSFILKKNPQSGMLIKSCRKGRLFAWYTDAHTFNIYFRDSDMEVSYGKEDFEYMDATRYNSPVFLINAFHDFLHHMKNKDDKDIVGYENILMINQIKSKPYNIKEFNSHFQDDYEFTFEEVAVRNYRITIKTKKTIRELIHLGLLLAIFNALTNNDLGYISGIDIDKYMFCLRVVDAPYYIRHLFAVYFLETKRLFKKYKPLLEKSEKVKLEFEFGNSLIQRMDAISKYFDFKSDIIDIGCGEGNYVREFAPKLDKKNLYHAIDINPESIERIKKFCTKEGIENVKVWSSVEEFVSSGNITNNSDILMTEVVEHMSKEDAALLINKVLRWSFKSIIITTPNREFNSNYCILEDEYRNKGHLFEMTKEEFRIWIERIAGNNGSSIKFFEIGDRVNNLQPTLAVSISKKGMIKT